MLTIKAPIEIKCDRPMFASHEIFANKITGNYELIPADLEREDLLHVVMMPPQVYIGDGSISNIVSDTNISNVRETKLDVINNLLNRIAVTEEVNLTYQDRAYITDVLQRLGVTDVAQFMSELTEMKRETRNVSELTALYETHLEQLHQTLNRFEDTTRLQQRAEKNFAGDERLYLHEDIFNRLQTGSVYQVLNNFYSAHTGLPEGPDGTQLLFSEQERMNSQIRLNTLESEIAGGNVPFVYRYENSYVEENISDEEFTENTANSKITSALLLDMANDVYVNLTRDERKREEVWVNAQDSFYQTAENTLQRLSLRMEERTSERTVSKERTERLEQYESEKRTIMEFLSLRERVEQTRIQSVSVPGEESHASGENAAAPVTLTYQTVGEESVPDEGNLPKGKKSRRKTKEERQFTKTMNSYLSMFFTTKAPERANEGNVSNVSKAGAEENIVYPSGNGQQTAEIVTKEEGTPHQIELQYLTGQTEEETAEEEGVKGGSAPGVRGSEGATVTERTDHTLREREILHEREKYSVSEGAEYNTVNEYSAQETDISYSEETGESGIQEKMRLTEEEELTRQLDEINRRNEETYRRYQQLVQDQMQKSAPSGKQEGTSVSRMREESLRALEHPDEVLMEHRKRQNNEEEESDAIENALLTVMPQDSRQILEKLGEMQQSRQAAEASGIPQQDNTMEQLMYDIREVEEENRTKVEEVASSEREIERVSDSVLEERQEYSSPSDVERSRSEREYESVSMVHRTLENSLDEEEIAQLIAENQVVQRENTQVTEVEENVERQQTNLQQQVNHTQVQQTEDINELIQRSVRQQMGTLSDEIYTNMERRLDRERKRRGY